MLLNSYKGQYTKFVSNRIITAIYVGRDSRNPLIHPPFCSAKGQLKFRPNFKAESHCPESYQGHIQLIPSLNIPNNKYSIASSGNLSQCIHYDFFFSYYLPRICADANCILFLFGSILSVTFH